MLSRPQFRVRFPRRFDQEGALLKPRVALLMRLLAGGA